MGGMTAAALLANCGYKVAVLEAAHALGGCSSSYYRQGYWFESGATTLIGFDEHQPLRYLEQQTGIAIPRIELRPSMQVHQHGQVVTRFKDRRRWIAEAGRVFGNAQEQEQFWELAYRVSDAIWKVALKNNFFPPISLRDAWELIKTNSASDLWLVPYALRSVAEVIKHHHIDSPAFERFVDEQLMITAQATAKDTPFLFGAAGLTYTNYANFYVPGGLIKMVHVIRDFIEEKGGVVRIKSPVERLAREGTRYHLFTPDGHYTAPVVVSNIPVWNMVELTSNEIRSYFAQEAASYEQTWGAFTMGVVTADTYPADLPLHHQLHFSKDAAPQMAGSGSVFVSLSHPEDTQRAEKGSRVLNISMHTRPEQWFMDSRDGYEQKRMKQAQWMIDHLQRSLPGFQKQEIKKQFSATPLTWEKLGVP